MHGIDFLSRLCLNELNMMQTPKLPPHAGYPGKPEYNAATERKRGLEAARTLLGPVYRQPDVYSQQNTGGSISAADQLLSAGEGAATVGKRDQASLLIAVGRVPEFAEAQQRLDIARAKARDEKQRFGVVSQETKRAIKTNRELALGFNESLKDYLDLHSSESLDYVAGLMAGSYKLMMSAEGNESRVGAEVMGEVYNTARGMRGELVAEQILGRFEDVEIHYHITDDEAMRRRLDAAGTDYMITVTLYGRAFDLAVDIKANKRSTVDDDGYDLPGKLWSQCEDSDFDGNTSRIDGRKLGHKYLPMQDALIEQIRLQCPNELEALAKSNGDELTDIYIN